MVGPDFSDIGYLMNGQVLRLARLTELIGNRGHGGPLFAGLHGILQQRNSR
jgi:hypothetical protein